MTTLVDRRSIIVAGAVLGTGFAAPSPACGEADATPSGGSIGPGPASIRRVDTPTLSIAYLDTAPPTAGR